MADIKIRIPDKSTPGFPRRLKRASEFKKKVDEIGFTEELIDSIVDFFAEYIEGDNIEAQKELAWDLSEEQFNQILDALGGGGQQIPPPNAEALDTPSKDTTPIIPNGQSA